VFGDVSIDNFANITAAGGDGIQTTEFGAGGNISVTDEASTTITANRFGIYADSYSSGNISILTSNNDVIDSTAGGEAIFAINNALAVPIGSTIDVTARGTILSGSKTFAGFTAVAAGIVPAYNANGTATNSVAGNVRVDDFASITTPAGTDGIRAYNEGIGTVTVIAESTANIAAGGNGISAFGAGGGNVSVTNGGTVSGSFGIQATGHLGGNVVVINNGTVTAQTSNAIDVTQNFALATGSSTITNTGTILGAVGHGAIEVDGNASGTVTIHNLSSGFIDAAANSPANQAISETVANITIDNDGQIVGDVSLANTTFNNNSGAVWTISGSNMFGAGIDVINNAGTIDVIGNSSFTAAGILTINNTGTVNVKSGALVIAGSVTGTGSIIVENGASLEISGSVAANEIMTFAGTTGTVKLDLPPSNITIAGMAGNDGIDLAGFDSNSITIGAIAYNTISNTTAVPISDAHGHSTTLTLVENYTGSTFTPSSDNNGGTTIIDPPASPLVDTTSTIPVTDVDIGSDTINSGTTLELVGASGADVSFANTSGHTGTLVLEDSVSFTGQITGFAGDGTVLNSDSIDLKDINFATPKEAYSDGTLTVSAGVDVASTHFDGSYDFGNFIFSSDGHGGTLVVDPPIAGNGSVTSSQSTDALDPVTAHDINQTNVASSSENNGSHKEQHADTPWMKDFVSQEGGPAQSVVSSDETSDIQAKALAKGLCSAAVAVLTAAMLSGHCRVGPSTGAGRCET
jgi:hypothetical protein